jgi:SNF2 family DNA or RNA helicase
MGEGVDLHLDCRHTIHHDLDWNPSVLEQRTGRLDRLGSKSELTHQPIVVYEPFLEGTQDEKQYRVVKDRERWFNVVMGEKLELDEASTDRLVERVELPVELARSLALRLEIRGGAR